MRMELGDLPAKLETQRVDGEVQIVGLIFDHLCAGNGIGRGGLVSLEDRMVGQEGDDVAASVQDLRECL